MTGFASANRQANTIKLHVELPGGWCDYSGLIQPSNRFEGAELWGGIFGRIAGSFTGEVSFPVHSQRPSTASSTGMSAASLSAKPSRVYVADFTSTTLHDDNLLLSFTDQFETALIDSHVYTVLNRDHLAKLLRESKSEASLTSLQDISSQVRSRIQHLEAADAVIFGQVTDDLDSGELIITVTLETFDSVKQWKHSKTMKRGLIRDYTERQNVLNKLVEESKP